MAWRLARSLVVLRDEARTVAPGTTVWTIGDQDHRSTWSDHNENDAGVVCAGDFLGDGGLDLAHLAETVRTSGHPAAKYVIYRDRIASRSQGWVWRPYGGQFHRHVHVSVGRGPDGRSTGPYDDTSPWGISEGDDMSLIGLSKGDSGQRVKGLQACLHRAGFGDEVGEIDGEYGPKTSAGVLACRLSQGSGAESGDTVTGHAFAQILSALAEHQAGGGDRGPRGPEGPPGQLPETATISGTVRMGAGR